MAKRKNDNPFTTTLIEYLHVDGSFARSLDSPVSVVRDLVSILGSILGEDQLGPRDVDIGATAIVDRKPGEDWRWSPENKWFSLLQKGVHGHNRLTAPDLEAVENNIHSVGLSRNRRGAGDLKMSDWMWDVQYEAEARYPYHQYDAHLRLSVRTHYFFDKREGPKPRRLVESVMGRLVAAGDMYFGLVTCSHHREDGSGLCYDYGGSPSNWSSLHFQTLRELWNELGPERRQKVRDIYWGQYLSPWHLERLGGKAAFRASFTEARGPDLRYKLSEWVTDYQDAGLFIRLSPDPLNYSLKGLDVPCGDLGAWLHKHFKAAGMLL
jgi:hypothetical protein